MAHRPDYAPLPSQPRPLRVIAALTAVVTLIVGGLPTAGVPLSPEATGWLVGVVGALSAVAVALLGEPQVTPIRSPRAADGTPLTLAGSETSTETGEPG